MKNSIQKLLIAFMIIAGVRQVGAQGTAFTYQGRLNSNAVPANGFYDFEFSLSNAPSGGSQIGSTLTQTDVGVTNGLFTTTLDFGSVFTGNSTWLAISVRSNGVGSYIGLTPLQELNPTPYAIFANTSSNVSGSLPATQITGTIPQAQLPSTVVVENENGVTLSNLTIGGTLNLPNPATIEAAGGSLLYANANGDFFAGIAAGNSSVNDYYNTGVGFESLLELSTGSYNSAIGTLSLFDNSVGSFNTANGAFALEYNTTGSNNTATGAYALSAANVPLYVVGTGNTADGAYAMEGNESGYNNTAVGFRALNANTNGIDNVAIGVDALQDLNDGSANYLNTSVGTYSFPAMTAGYYNTGMGAYSSYELTTGYYNSGMGAYSLYELTNGSFNTALGIFAGYYLQSGSDNIYIGSYGEQGDNYVTRIGEYQTDTFISSWNGSFLDGVLSLDQGDTNNGMVAIENTGNYPGLNFGGNGTFVYGFDGGALGTVDPTEVSLAWNFEGNVWCSNNFSTLSLTIRGGSDLAEPFKITPGTGAVPDGSVVVIDDVNPGRLKVSSEPYDTRVAGILSGANGVHPGIQMQQQGLMEGDRNVALTGRVYVQADASNGAIKPGDLLTTSSTPGRAMKVTDHVRAQGAILGKAMSGLSEGNGMVLVLVTLQ